LIIVIKLLGMTTSLVNGPIHTRNQNI